MNKPIIVVAGGTGTLGMLITKELLNKGAEVRVLVRETSSKEKKEALETMGAQIWKTDLSDAGAVAKAGAGASCVVSALAGGSSVILGLQQSLLMGAVQAGIPRFIPSDYSLDFTPFAPGSNRNLDLRRDFHRWADRQPITLTSIFNGAFMELLTGDMPMIFPGKNLVMHWGASGHKMTFTTIPDTARYTAFAALDSFAPRYLRIAGDQISPSGIRDLMNGITGRHFRLLRLGGTGLLGVLIRAVRFFAPSPGELYPAWQGMQYMHNMMDERALVEPEGNSRYPELKWTSVKEMLIDKRVG